MNYGRGKYAILYPPKKLDPNITYNAAYFNSLTPPPNYIPGISRGAVGFTTRSDLGPLDKLSTKKIVEKLKEDKPLIEYSKEDQAADDIWKSIEERRKNKRKREDNVNNNKSISKNFADLKTQLKDVTTQDWMTIPESYDSSIKRRKFETYTANSDSVILKSQLEAQAKDLHSIGEARRNVIMNSIRNIEEQASNTNIQVNARDYISKLESQLVGGMEISELQRAREMMKSLTSSNPTHSPGWIASARIEEISGKMNTARSIIKEGCEKCPYSEDIWLESSRLHCINSIAESKSILAEAVTFLPQSEKIWLAASELEDNLTKKRVLRKALEHLPYSERIWKKAIDIENDDENALLLLQRAVECIPSNIEFAIALAKLSPYNKAKEILNEIRLKAPNEAKIWIVAAQLEELAKSQNTNIIILKAISTLNSRNVPFDREIWISYAKDCEDLQCLQTVNAIISNVLEKNLLKKDYKDTFREDAKKSIMDGHLETAKSILRKATELLPTSKGIWKTLIQVEEEFGDEKTTIEISKKALQFIPDSELLWIKTAKTQFKLQDIDGAKETLKIAIEKNTNSEIIHLASASIYIKLKEWRLVEKILEQGRNKCESPIIWMKSAIFYRNIGNRELEIQILDESLSKYKTLDKLWIMRSQYENNHLKSLEILKQGLEFCPSSIRLWLCCIKLLADSGNFAQARALLDQSKLKIKSDLLSLIEIRIEILSGSQSIAMQLLSRSLQEFPNSAQLWKESIILSNGTKRIAQAVLSLQECEPHPILFCTIANIFWMERAETYSRLWFNKALKLDYMFGDTWIQYFAFEKAYGNEETCNQMIKRIEEIQPQYGEKWATISKDPKNHSLKSKEILLEGVNLFSLQKEFDRNNIYFSTYCRETID